MKNAETTDTTTQAPPPPPPTPASMGDADSAAAPAVSATNIRAPETDHENVIAELAGAWNLSHCLVNEVYAAWNDLKGYAGTDTARMLLVMQMLIGHYNK